MSKKLSKDEKLAMKVSQSLHDELSEQLFGKPEVLLKIAEQTKLDRYINDYLHPIWKLVETDRGDLVEVSNVGQVRDPVTKELYKVYIPETADGKVGYPIVGIKGKDGKQYPQTVHRLVAKAFCNNPDPNVNTQVNHINGIKTCPWYENLEWVTPSENRLHAFRIGLQAVGEDHGKSKYINDQVKQICQLLQDHPDYTYEKIAEIVGVPKHLVNDIYNRNTWTSISRNYVFPPRETHAKGENGPNNKYPVETIEKICKMLDDVSEGTLKMTHQQIADAAGVGLMIVRDVSAGRTWVDVSSKHPFYKKKFG